MQELLLKMGGGRIRGGGVFAGFYGTVNMTSNTEHLAPRRM